MSGTVERIRLGATRTRRIRLMPGMHEDNGHMINATIPFYIVETQEFRRYDYNRQCDWIHKSYDWTTMQPDPPAHIPPVVKISWWRRLFRLGPKIPKMKVVP